MCGGKARRCWRLDETHLQLVELLSDVADVEFKASEVETNSLASVKVRTVISLNSGGGWNDDV